MLLSVTGPASEAMRAVFLRTQDDLLVLRCLRGFRSHARACVYLGLLAPFDSALVFFFQRGLEYASAAAEGAAGPPFPGEMQAVIGYPRTQSFFNLFFRAHWHCVRVLKFITLRPKEEVEKNCVRK